MPRYFLNERANHQMVGSGIRADFKFVGIFGGRMLGVLETENEVLAGALAAAGRHGVKEIDKAEYDQLLAQKKTTQVTLPGSNEVPLPPRGQSLTQKVGVESVGGTASAVLSAEEKKMSPKDCIVIGAVNSPEPMVEERDRVASVVNKKRRRAA